MKTTLIILLIILLGAGTGYYLWLQPQTSFLLIEGEKPREATIVAFARLIETNPECEKTNWLTNSRYFTFVDTPLTPKYDQDKSHYRLSVPIPERNANRCQIELQRVKIFAKNAYDGAFAPLTLNFTHKTEQQTQDLATTPEPVVKAKNCQTKLINQEPSTDFFCDYYYNGRLIQQETVEEISGYLPGEMRHPDTVIRYDIQAGERYMTEPKR